MGKNCRLTFLIQFEFLNLKYTKACKYIHLQASVIKYYGKITCNLIVELLDKISKNTTIKIVNLPEKFPVINSCGKEGRV
jgi:hypothetical protein